MKAFLVLESGDCFEGLWQGGEPRAGEVVFNTSHSGYEEIATDPSYFSQIVVLTAPMQGNYGIEDAAWESRQIWIDGFVCLQISNSAREKSWLDRLTKTGVPLVSDMDTRAVTLKLRSHGTPWGALVPAESKAAALTKAQELIAQKKKMEKDWVYLASRKQIEKIQGQKANGPRVAVLDFGAKENILRELKQRCKELVVYPSRTPVEKILESHPDGLMLTNGPGDPGDVKQAPETVRALIGKLPIFGICMGHQILGIALGAKTYRLKFGHRGANHPIKDSLLGKVYISSQNHGYAVDQNTVPKDVKVTHVNLNDQSVAGFYSEIKNCLGIQYHPESHPGPHDAVLLFDYFIDHMVKKKADRIKSLTNERPVL